MGIIMIALPAVAAALVVSLSGCGGSEGQPSQEEFTAYAEAMPPIGVAVTFYALTHCGVEHARIGGHWWRAEEPLASKSGVSSHPGGTTCTKRAA